jgi:alpha-L-arabinofuranosidase
LLYAVNQRLFHVSGEALLTMLDSKLGWTIHCRKRQMPANWINRGSFVKSSALADSLSLPLQVGAKIDRNIFGQFAEHLGSGVYEGVWVGPDSKIPNTRGIRNDVVAALKAIRAPNVRWPGGCFADDYHWRKGIGSPRNVSLNPSWGGVIEPNTFGTHEFMDFLNQIGAEAYLAANIGSGTPQEAAEWLEYMTTAQPTTLAKERTVNGHPAPKVDSVNAFDAPNTVAPKPVSAKVQGGKLTLKLEPKSVTVISVEQ